MSRNTLKTCLFVIINSIVLLYFQPVHAQYNFAAMDPFLKNNQRGLGGDVVCLIWKDGKVIYQKEMGEFNAKTAVPIASCSKWLTAALVMQMVDQGKLKLDDPVAKYIPIFSTYMKRYLTIRHCLSQTTGLEKEGGLIGKIAERSKYESLEEEVNAIAAKEITNNPGEVFFYGGYGLNIAARVCEVISKKPFERLIQEKLTRPLKMKSTSFANDMGGACNPSGGAKASANDYINFLSMLLNNGQFEGKQILSAASVNEMHKIQFGSLPIKYAPPAAQGCRYGLGNWILTQDSQGNGTKVACPGLFGTWPYIDFEKKYAAILFVSNLKIAQRKEIDQQFMETIDTIIQ